MSRPKSTVGDTGADSQLWVKAGVGVERRRVETCVRFLQTKSGRDLVRRSTGIPRSANSVFLNKIERKGDGSGAGCVCMCGNRCT